MAPAELEGHLLDHPDVADSCVVGVPDDYSGELPLAFVALSESALERVKKDPAEAGRIKAALMKVRIKGVIHYSIVISHGPPCSMSPTRRWNTNGLRAASSSWIVFRRIRAANC